MIGKKYCMPKWIIFQNGSREHYALPRMFYKNNQLEVLVTDIWLNPDNLLSKLIFRFLPKSRSRFHSDLKSAHVVSWNYFFLLIQLLQKFKFFKKRISYDSLIKRKFSHYLKKYNSKEELIVFSYNYVAAEIFKVAKNKGYKCILGQIDAGPLAGEINRNLFKEVYGGTVQANPDLYLIYGNEWKQECELASHIVVNSNWSKTMLMKAGVLEDKLKIIELAYVTPKNANGFTRAYPEKFSKDLPLKVLFLGSLKLLKGIKPMLDAIRLLKDEPIMFYLVGSIQVEPMLLKNLPQNCIITGSVDKEKALQYFKECDIMVLPTYSDGFAMTQLEAQAWKMPIIATERCGKVVDDNINGIIIKEISGMAIADAINQIIANPVLLNQFAKNCIDLNKYSLEFIYSKYASLA